MLGAGQAIDHRQRALEPGSCRPCPGRDHDLVRAGCGDVGGGRHRVQPDVHAQRRESAPVPRQEVADLPARGLLSGEPELPAELATQFDFGADVPVIHLHDGAGWDVSGVDATFDFQV